MRKINYILIFLFLIVQSCGIHSDAEIPNHITSAYTTEIPQVEKRGDTLRKFNENFLLKNQYGIWEMFVSGNAMQLGLNHGALGEDLAKKQERIFFEKIKKKIPKKSSQKLLQNFLNWYNKKIPDHVSSEYQAEIYGVSRYLSEDYNWVASNYKRALYLHAAHDIGHALKDLMLVGCSSLAVWGEYSADGELLIGRNFDFYVGDDFAEEKMIAFVRPDNGIPYMSISWPGMTGVVSGMNLKGLTVTINAGKSKIPLRAKTPISLVAKEILQYAQNIEEAIALAKKKQVFVSESIMIGSAQDRKAILIELSPKKMGVYEVENVDKLLCSNHFQSEEYKNDKRNTRWMEQGHSLYRWKKMDMLTPEHEKLTPEKMAEILRNMDGILDENIGYGNEKALNQLLAHHAVIFAPEKKRVWVSTSPYQLGKMLAFDLEKIFDSPSARSFVNLSASIEASPFLLTKNYANYEEYRKLDAFLQQTMKEKKKVSDSLLLSYERSNPKLWKVYETLGNYYRQQKKWKEADRNYHKALHLEIPTLGERKRIIKKMKNKRKNTM